MKILFLLDGSSSMLDDWQPGKERFTVASDIINTIVDSIVHINPSVQFALRVFGHEHIVQENNCFDTKLEVPFSRGNMEQMKARLRHVSPRGVSPIAYSLQVTANEDFQNSELNAYSIILLTDGGESCGGNLCDVITKLLNEKVSFKPYILSLVNDSFLQKDYDCLGKYLTVSSPNQIAPAIKTILDDNRIMYERNDGSFAQLKQEPKQPERLEPKPPVQPEVKVVTQPEVKPVVQPEVKVSEVQSQPNPKKVVVEKISGNRQGGLLPIPSRNVVVTKKIFKGFNQKPNIVFFVEEVEEVKPRGTIILLTRQSKPLGLRRINNIWVFEEAKFTKAIAKPIKFTFVEEQPSHPIEPGITLTPNKPVTATATKPLPVKTVQTDAPVVVKKEKSEETKLFVYFTDGRGKYYKTEPKIDFVNIKTNKVVQSNYRLVDRSTGAPEAIKIPPGTYRITRSGSSFRSATFTIEENTTGRVDVVINKGSIMFRYQGNPNRPVIEYSATIQNSVDRGPIARQRCDELLEYEPGIYHIEINTLPPLVLTLPDLKFGEVNIVDIKEPGIIAVNSNLRGKIQLWYQRGTKYEPFYDMVLTGNIEKQKQELQPGVYLLYYFKDGKEQNMKFTIKSNFTTTINL
ncbi:MAG TPA: VWA domain-containing protein [Edaphocola sp.]|nr:VWA domain-containing protein [Edaphocola sp.]